MGEIDYLAIRQLARWEHLAIDWPVFTDDVAGIVRCAHDNMAIWRLRDNQGRPYSYTKQEILALRVAHLRNHHPDLDPNEDTV